MRVADDARAGACSLVIDRRPEDEKGTLKAAYRPERRPDVRPRRYALRLMRGRRGVRAVAQLVRVHERTVPRWVGWYRAGGLPTVAAPHPAGTGQPSFLTAAQPVVQG
jgi:transposase